MRTYASDALAGQDELASDPYQGRPNLWLRLASAGWEHRFDSIEARELARRSRMAAWIILGLFVVDGLLLPVGLGDPGTLVAVVGVAASLVVATFLNRRGLVSLAGGIIVLVICAGVVGALVSEPGGLHLDALPAYDLLAIPVVAAASILPRASVFIVAPMASGLIIADFLLQPHFPDLTADLKTGFCDPATHACDPTVGVITMLARPVGLVLIIALVAYLWVRGTDEAIRRADRSEELLRMEHQLAEQSHQLEIGIRQILDTHIRVSNGDISARAPLTQENVLFQIAASLNNLLNRLGRTMQAEYVLQRTAAEIARLRDSLVAARAGRPPLWPAPSGTPVDALLAVLAPTPGHAPAPDMGRLAGQAGVPGQTGAFGPPGPLSGPSAYAQPGGFGQTGAIGQPGPGSGQNGYGPTAGLGGPSGVPLGSSGRLDRRFGAQVAPGPADGHGGAPNGAPDMGWMPDGMRPDAGGPGGSSWDMPPLPDWPPRDGHAGPE